MTPDPLSAALDQLAACRERIADLDAREAAHYGELSGQVAQLAGMVTTISRALAEDTAALARLDALDRQVTDLTRHLAGPGDDDDGYQPPPGARPGASSPPASARDPSRELRDWVEHVYRPGYGHLAALGPCWPQHHLCLYGAGHPQPALVRALPPPRAHHQPAVGPGRVPGPHPARPRRPAGRRDHRLRPRHRRRLPRSTPMTDNPVHSQALAYAERGWPVFPCQPGQKIPATPHGYLDATTDPAADHRLVRPPPGPEPRRRHRLPRPRRPRHRQARRSRRRLPRPGPA